MKSIVTKINTLKVNCFFVWQKILIRHFRGILIRHTTVRSPQGRAFSENETISLLLTLYFQADGPAVGKLKSPSPGSFFPSLLTSC